METQKNKKPKIEDSKNINRKQAIQKLGISALVSSSLIFLSPAASPKTSPIKKPKKPGRG